ncbi:unnamed protein product, partial [Rotaria magnacalcarata]
MDIDDNPCRLSDKSDSPHEQILIQPIQIPSNPIVQSDQLDMNDSDTS